MANVRPIRAVETRSIGLAHGKRRIWIEGSQALRGGFEPGATYNRDADAKRSILTLTLADGQSGKYKVTPKSRGERVVPVIDVNSEELIEELFSGLSEVRIIVQPTRIIVMPLASALRAKERLARLKAKMSNKEPLTMGSLSAGVGILDRAIHDGLKQSGIETKLVFSNEIRKDCQDHAAEYNPIHTDETIDLTMPMQEMAFDEWLMSNLPRVDILIAGVPCSGASVAGRAKNKIAMPENHPEVGHLVVPLLSIIARLGPVSVVLECVTEWLNTASAALARSMLNDLGYEVHETELNSRDWNHLEERRRMCLVAVTKGISFDFDLLKPEPQEVTFGEVMEDVSPDASTWGRIDYIWSKLEKDKAAGKGFSPTVVDANSTKVPVLNKTLHKRQSTGTYIQHPENPDLYRIPTVTEHAKVKDAYPDMFQNVTQTFGHESLGQSVCTRPFIAAGQRLGMSFHEFNMFGQVAAVSTMASRIAA